MMQADFESTFFRNDETSAKCFVLLFAHGALIMTWWYYICI